MTSKMGVALGVAVWALAGFGVGCGDSKSGSDAPGGAVDAGDPGGDVIVDTGDAGACDPGHLPKLPNTGIGYPDSYCDKDGCVADACDPFGRCQPACNAWALVGKLSFQAVTVKDKGTPGAPPEVTGKDSNDNCPGNMVSAVGADVNCCQRGDNVKAEHPALKLTSLTMTRPVYFASAAVAGVNKMAIEGDQYNWVAVLSSGKDGPLTATSGNAMPNKDGSFTSVAGPFKSAGMTFNDKGVWDAQPEIPGMLSTEGDQRFLDVGPTSSVRDYVMVMWIDKTYDFARLELHMRGLHWKTPIEKNLSCAGARTPGQFEQVGTLTGFVPLDAAIRTEIFLARTGSQNLCTSMSGAADCKAPIAKWKPAS